jgi:hypothetical protein
LESAKLRKQLTREAMEESYDTYYDTPEGPWGWWVRIEGHFVQMAVDKK